jgi:signal transduction histidine kinase
MANMLLPIRAHLEVLRTYDLPEDAREDVEAVCRCAAHLQNLTRGLRSLSRDPDHGQLGTTDINTWFSTAVPLLRHALNPAIELICEVMPDLPPAPLSDHCLTQAVLNMVTNAGDAIGSHPAATGVVTIRLRYDAVEGVIRLSVSDNGPGMTAEVRRRCTEPFFTTRPLTVSTGLGLAIVHNLAIKAHGRLEIESRLGHGTTVTMVMRAKERPGSDQPSLFQPPTK